MENMMQNSYMIVSSCFEKSTVGNDLRIFLDKVADSVTGAKLLYVSGLREFENEEDFLEKHDWTVRHHGTFSYFVVRFVRSEKVIEEWVFEVDTTSPFRWPFIASLEQAERNAQALAYLGQQLIEEGYEVDYPSTN